MTDSTVPTVEDLLRASDRGYTARECGRLLWEATEHEPVLKDAMSAVLCIIDACDWSMGPMRDSVISDIKDHLIAGFHQPGTYEGCQPA